MENEQNNDDEIKKILAQKGMADDPEFYYNQGAAFSRVGKYEEAIKKYDKAQGKEARSRC